MNTVFVGGSRHVSKLSRKVKERLDTVIKNSDKVIVGDANGADKAVQKYLSESGYQNVLIYCSGEKSRNNIGSWPTRNVEVDDSISGFQFFAAKDRKMANDADFGLMIWDGKSAGTVLNVLRLIAADKKAVLHKTDTDLATIIKTKDQWRQFVAECSPALRDDLKKRATKDERTLLDIQGIPEVGHISQKESSRQDEIADTAAPTEFWYASSLNTLFEANSALAHCDSQTFIALIGELARLRGMTHISRESGLARESLYRSLHSDGNPEFNTILRVLDSVGIKLEAKFVGAEADGNLASRKEEPKQTAVTYSKRR